MPPKKGRPAFKGLAIRPSTGGRITIPEPVARLIGWYKPGEKHECPAIVSPHLSLAIFSPVEMAARDSIAEKAVGLELGLRDLGGREAMLALIAPNFWRVTIQSNGQMRLPADAQRMGLVPAGGEDAGITVAGDVIHVWRLDRLLSALAEGARDWGRLAGPDEYDSED